MIPQKVINYYKLQDKVTTDGWLHHKIRKAIYGLKESGKLANIKLQTVLASEGYKLCRFTHGLYRHEARNITFSLVVDNFGVRYINKRDAFYLIKTLKRKIRLKLIGKVTIISL